MPHATIVSKATLAEGRITPEGVQHMRDLIHVRTQVRRGDFVERLAELAAELRRLPATAR